MMALRSHRGYPLSGLFTLLAGLLLPAGLRAEEPVASSYAAAPAPAPLMGQSAVSLDPESQVPGLLAAGRCDLALATLFNMEPSQRHTHEMIWFCRAYHQCSGPKETIAACTAVLQRGDVFSVSEREEAQRYAGQALAQYQPLPPFPAAPAAARPPELPPPVSVVNPVIAAPVAPAPAEPQAWEARSRFSFHVRPFWSLFTPFGAGLLDFKFEHVFKSGLLLGAELSPIVLSYPTLGFQGRVKIGYGSRAFAIGLATGSGFPLYYPQFGFFFRAGRLERSYVEFSLNWSLPIPYPLDGLIHISARTSDNWRFKMDIGGSYLLYGPYLLLGGERVLSRSSNGGTSGVNFGFGFVFPVIAFGIPGPLLSVGYEKRF